MAIIVLRFYDKTRGSTKVPGNIKVGRYELPLGLFMIFPDILFATACVNLLTKRVATISGSIFTLAFFTRSSPFRSRSNKRKLGHQSAGGKATA
jgi:hypothetical protein